MIAILVTLILFLCALAFSLSSARGKSEWDVIEYAVFAPFCVLFVICAIVGGACFSISLANYSKLAAYAEVAPLYDEAIDQTKQAVVMLDGKLTIVSLENQRHSTNTSGRILEARIYRRAMIEKREFYRILTGNWFTRCFVARPPDGLLNK